MLGSNGQQHVGAASRIASLETLRIRGEVEEGTCVDVSCLSALGQLRTLCFHVEGAQLQGMQAMAFFCVQLRFLDVEAACISPPPQQQPSAGPGPSSAGRWWPALQKADLTAKAEAGVAALGLLHAASLTDLRVVAGQPEMAEIAKLTALTGLVLANSDGSFQPSPMDVSPLSALKQLQEVYIDLLEETECFGVQALAQGCSRLLKLSFSDCLVQQGQQGQLGQEQGQQQQQQQQTRGYEEERWPQGQQQEQQGQVQQGEEEQQGQAQQGEEQPQGQVQGDLPWWPSLTSFFSDSIQPKHLALMHLHKARQLRNLNLCRLTVKEGSPASEPAAVREVCEQLVACAEAARLTGLYISLGRWALAHGASACHACPPYLCMCDTSACL